MPWFNYTDLEQDFQLSSTRFTISPTLNFMTFVSFRVDRIAQEPVETAQLGLSVFVRALPSFALVQDRFDLIIIDSDGELICV